MVKNKWTAEMKATLRRMYPDCENEGIALVLGISAASVRSQASVLGLEKSEEYKERHKPRRKRQGAYRCEHFTLSPADEKWFKLHYKHTSNEAIMQRLGITWSMLHRLARLYGLKKSPQFLKKMQLIGSQMAKESHLRNGTYPPKGYRIPGSEKGCFKKGESNRDRLTPKRYAEYQEKRRLGWIATREADHRRWKWDLPQKTKFRFSSQTPAKAHYRHNMKKRGYIEIEGQKNRLYYSPETVRRPKAESNAVKHGIKILPIEEAV